MSLLLGAGLDIICRLLYTFCFSSSVGEEVPRNRPRAGVPATSPRMRGAVAPNPPPAWAAPALGSCRLCPAGGPCGGAALCDPACGLSWEPGEARVAPAFPIGYHRRDVCSFPDLESWLEAGGAELPYTLMYVRCPCMCPVSARACVLLGALACVLGEKATRCRRPWTYLNDSPNSSYEFDPYTSGLTQDQSPSLSVIKNAFVLKEDER